MLSKFLLSAAALPFVYGKWDCGRFCARWVFEVRGVEPGAEWNGRYQTALGLARIIKRRGGMVAHFDQCLAEIGISQTDAPTCGDIAVVDAPEGPAGAIMLGDGFSACLIGPGLSVRRLAVLAAWRL